MHKEFLMGNAAIALGAVAAGVNVVSRLSRNPFYGSSGNYSKTPAG